MPTKRTKRKDGNYAIRRKVAPYKDRNGNIKTYKTFYGKTVKDAERKYNEYKNGANNTPLFFDDLINDYIENFFVRDPKHAASTKQRYIDAYRNNLEIQKDFIHKPITDISYTDIQNAYNKMRCAPSTIKNVHKLLRLFFALMISQRIIVVDPTDAVILPETKKTEREIITFTAAELEQIKAYIMRDDLPAQEQKRVDRLRFMILLLINTGARISEILALTYDDITPEGITINKQVINQPYFENGITVKHEITIGKTKTANSNRHIPITSEIYLALLDHKKRHKREQIKNGYRTGYVFTTSTGTLYDTHNIRHALDKVHSAAGVSAHGMHTYRRTFGTMLAQKGIPIQVLCDLMGHKDISITAQYYIGVSDDEKKNAVKLMG